MNEAGVTASPKRRVAFLIVGAAMLGLWGWSLVPPIENWHNPHEDGFSYVPAFWATLLCLPTAVMLLVGTVVAQGRAVERAGQAFLVGCGVVFIVVAFLIFQYVANSMGGM